MNIVRSMNFAALALAAVASAASSAAQGVPANYLPSADKVEEIFVTARRSGIPVWHVTGPSSTLVLVGSIEEVSHDTRWNPGGLISALRQADQVIFPQREDFGVSPFAMIGYAIKFMRMAKLPEGQSLRQLMPPDQFNRLAALRQRGLLKSGFERIHPLHLAIELHGIIDGPKGFGLNAENYVKRAVKKYKLRQPLVARRNLKQPITALLSSKPEAHLPCLLGSIALVEAGQLAVKARSDAWAERRVVEVVNSLPTQVFTRCSLDEYLANTPDWRGSVKRALDTPKVTVAVIDLMDLAHRGGLLDELSSAGYVIKGPSWK